MTVPEGINNPLHLVCKLVKSSNGIRRAYRKWFLKLANELINQGFERSKNDYSLFVHKKSEDMTVVVVYVDDIIIT